MAHAGGRPSKYQDSFVEELDKYLTTTGKEQTSLPTKQGFALWLGVDDETLNEWASARYPDTYGDKDKIGKLIHPEFSATLRKLMQLQAKQLIDDGIYGGKEVNSTIIKLLLQNNHGMKEQTDLTTNGKDLPQTNSIVFTNFKADEPTSE
jgi:hypothetical protein